MKRHLAIFYPEVVQEILAGKKTVESRFSKAKIAPFGQIETGDLVYMKSSGKDISGQFTVSKVISFENLDKNDWEFIKKHYKTEISLGDPQKDEIFFDSKNDSKYGTLIFIGQVEQLITSPIRLKKHDKRGWVVLDS